MVDGREVVVAQCFKNELFIDVVLRVEERVNKVAHIYVHV